MGEFRIGSVTLPGNLILAPMAGVTDLPFRILCHEMGADLVCMEMVSAKAISYGNRNTVSLMQVDPGEHPVSMQLFGSEPELLGEVAEMVDAQPFEILDFNMGCPVPKVVNNGEGSSLMKNPELAEAILSQMVRHSTKPVTVKIRKGFDLDHVNAVEVALAAQAAGVSAIAIHGRTRSQYYSGNADWDIIRQVKEAVQIPVIGNGDVKSGPDAKRMLDETGCDAVMIGRGCEGNPWVFRQVKYYLEHGEEEPKPTTQEKHRVALRHACLLAEHKGEYIAAREMRKHLAWYTAGMPNASHFRGAINALESLDDIKKGMDDIFGPLEA